VGHQHESCPWINFQFIQYLFRFGDQYFLGQRKAFNGRIIWASVDALKKQGAGKFSEKIKVGSANWMGEE
jgi:hypothetical protein